MTESDSAQETRGIRLGAMLAEARQVRAQSVEACAAVLGLETGGYLPYEQGTASPSLPELELLAYFLDVPIKHFWGGRLLAEKNGEARPLPPASEQTALRDRLIGVRLRQTRLEAGRSLETLAEAAGLTPNALAAAEMGRQSLPVPTLEALASLLGLTIDHFREIHGRIGEWDSSQRAMERVRQLPPELREFVAKPVNESYLRLAHHLSQLSADRLRGIAESLLEITL